MKSTYIVLIVCLIISIKLDSNKADYGLYGFPQFWQRPAIQPLQWMPPSYNFNPFDNFAAPPAANPMPMQYYVPVPVPVPVPVEPSESSEPPKTQSPQSSQSAKSPQLSQSSRSQQTSRLQQLPQQSAEAKKAMEKTRNDNTEKAKAAMKSMADKYAPAVNQTMMDTADFDQAILGITGNFVKKTLDNSGNATVQGMKQLTNPTTAAPTKTY